MTDIVVRWSDYELAFMAERVRDGEEVYLNEYDGDEMYWIGNIHDNPELLEEGEE